jgi:DNA-3-methyladenine glycosylase I
MEVSKMRTGVQENEPKRITNALNPRFRDYWIQEVACMTVSNIIRCPWADGDEKMAKYHDEVWGIPVHDDQKLFAKLSLDLMQAGLMWRTILYKQDSFEKAFDGFNIETVAGYDELKYNELMQDAGIVRNQLKIRAIINNAARVLDVQKEFGSFDAYLWSFTNGDTVINAWRTLDEVPASTPLSDAISKDMKKRGFKFVGTTIIYAFLQAVGIVNDHLSNCFCYDRFGVE